MKNYSMYFGMIMLFFMLSCTQVQEKTENSYTVSIVETDMRTLHVKATINLTGNVLSMNWPSANSIAKGWAHFVENLKVYSLRGESIPITYTDKANWKLNTTECRVKITYDINIAHDKMEWPEGGHSASAYVVDNTLYLIGAALFIANPAEIKIGAGTEAKVHFNLPESYKMAVPWTTVEKERNSFYVNSTYELVRSAITIGDLELKKLNVNEMEIEIATASDFSDAIPLFYPIYEAIVPAAQRYFGDVKSDKYVIVANKAPRTEALEPYFSGEALHQSMSIISPVVPTEAFMPLFWYMLAHEYIHIWNGISIQAANESTASWFMEGFTDYITLELLHQLGKISDEDLINGNNVAGYAYGWGENIKKYLSVAGKISMRNAGRAKQENYDLIYSGGAVFALILDIEMNNATEGKTGVQELMAEVNKRFGTHGEKLLRYNNIKNLTSELCGADFDTLFDEYVDGTAIIPIQEHLAKAGLLIKNPGASIQKIGIDPNATEKQKMVLKAICGIK